MKYFYSYLVKIETITSKLDELDMTTSQRKHLAALVDSMIHQEILDIIFSKLADEDKILFIEHFQKDPGNPEIMELLNEKAGNIENEIKEVVIKIKKELHEDIKVAKRGGKD